MELFCWLLQIGSWKITLRQQGQIKFNYLITPSTKPQPAVLFLPLLCNFQHLLLLHRHYMQPNKAATLYLRFHKSTKRRRTWTKSNITRIKVPICILGDFFEDPPGEITYLIALIHFASASIFLLGQHKTKKACRQMFSCLLGMSGGGHFSGTLRTVFIQHHRSANLLFRLDKVCHWNTSALISFMTFTLVSRAGRRE